MLTLQNCTPKQKLLLETADHLFGKKFRELEAKPCDNVSAGEVVLIEKGVAYFQKQMEHFHLSITQLAFNMEKLAGDFCFNIKIVRSKYSYGMPQYL